MKESLQNNKNSIQVKPFSPANGSLKIDLYHKFKEGEMRLNNKKKEKYNVSKSMLANY